MTSFKIFSLILISVSLDGVQAFMQSPSKLHTVSTSTRNELKFSLNAATGEKAAQDVTGEELEIMLTEWDTPLVVDAYATW
jgi:hypothetical protein